MMKKMLIGLVVALLVAAGLWAAFASSREEGPGQGFAQGNGRLEATEINIAAKLAERLLSIAVDEGDYVEKGQILAVMQTDTLQAQLNEARAQKNQAVTALAGAHAQVALRESERDASVAAVAQAESELDGTRRRYNRSAQLVKEDAITEQKYDDDETTMLAAEAAVKLAEAKVKESDAAIVAAKADAEGARAAVVAADAAIARIEADIADSQLAAPRDGRVQYRVAQPGEVLAAGGRVLNMIDLTDVYMTFYLPTLAAGQVALGDEARLVLDAFPGAVFPATISFVSDSAQFTPKTVETHDERLKLVFRVKARLDPELLRKHIHRVKTGLPGVVWVKLDDSIDWPEHLAVTRPR